MGEDPIQEKRPIPMRCTGGNLFHLQKQHMVTKRDEMCMYTLLLESKLE